MKLRDISLSSFRSLVDSNDSFITGHRTMRVRQPKKIIPDALKSEIGVQNLLKKAFPNWKTDQRQKKQAGRWARVIQLHYKGHYSEPMTAEEMNVSLHVIKGIKRGIKRTISGVRLDGSGKFRRKNIGFHNAER